MSDFYIVELMDWARMRSMPERMHLRRLASVWARNPVFFVTACTFARRRLLNCPVVAGIVESAFRAAPQVHRWAIGRYVIMPDHVHFFAMPQLEAKSLSGMMRDWKKWTTRRMVEEGVSEAPIWQAEFFDHVLRTRTSYVEKWAYVRENPVRAGLTSCAEDWPFQGEIEAFRMHER